MGNGRKNIAQAGQPRRAGPKGISEAEVVASASGQKFFWDVQLMDTQVSNDDECRWTWRLEPDDLQELLQFLSNCSARTWAEIEADRTGGKKKRHKKHHEYDVSVICSEAQGRLYRLTDESHDKIFRLRYGGEKRLWGLRDRAVFHVIWIDLHHQVYPLDPN